MRIQRRRISETLINVLTPDLLFEIFSFSANKEIQFTIPLICKEFNGVLECAKKLKEEKMRISETLISVLPQELLFEIFSFSANEEIQFTIPFICKEFNRVLECAIRSRIIKRYCELCNTDKEDDEDDEEILERFGLRKIFDKENQEELFVCEGCREKCEICKTWVRLYKYEESCEICEKFFCGECGTKCADCFESRVCYGCFPDGLKNQSYECKMCYWDIKCV